MRKAVNNGRVRGEGRVRDISNVPTTGVIGALFLVLYFLLLMDKKRNTGPVFLIFDGSFMS